MTDSELYDQAFTEIFQTAPEALEGLRHHVTPEWDSLTHMSLIAAIEDKLNIMMEVDDIIEFDSYAKGKEILKGYGKTF